MLFAEIVNIGEEGGAYELGDGKVVRSRVRINRVALGDELLGDELAEVSEPDDGDLQLSGLTETVDEVRFVIVGLRGVDRTESEEVAAG